MTNATSLPATLPQTDWRPLPRAAVVLLREQILDEVVIRLEVVADLEEALDALARLPDARCAGDALNRVALMSPLAHSA